MLTSLALALLLTAEPTDAELQLFGTQIAKDFSEGRDGLSKLVDTAALFDRAMQGVDVPADFRGGFLKGFSKGMTTGWQTMAKESADQGSARMTRIITWDGGKGVQLRFLVKSGAFNVLEMYVKKNDAGQLKIVDFYQVTSGTTKSKEVRLVAASALQGGNGGLFDRVMGKEESLLIKHSDVLQKLNTAAMNNDPIGAETAWKTLPKELQDNGLFLKPYITALSSGDEAKYRKEMAHFLGLYPEDPAAQVMGVDFYYLAKKWVECRKSINAVEKRTGRDAWFNFLRGGTYLAEGKYADAKKEMLAGIEYEPDLKNPYYSLIDIGLAEKKWSDVTKWMKECETHLGVTFDVSAPGFEEYAASKEGKAWQKSHPKP